MKLSELESQHSILQSHSGPSPSDFFDYVHEQKKWQCRICGGLYSTHHGSRWSHIHTQHPEALK